MPGKGVKFAAGTAVIGTATYFLLQIVMPFLKPLTAGMSAAILSLFGTAWSEGSIVFFESFSALLIPLCVGDIEIAVLTGAILSTADRKWGDRIMGVAAAFAFVMLVNTLRVAATMLAWQAWGIGALETVHSVLFRATLVAAIVGFYAVWYLRDLIKKKLKWKRLLREK